MDILESSWAGRVYTCTLRTTLDTSRLSTRQPGLGAASRLRDSGSSRSFPQCSDGRQARKRRLCNPLGGRKSALLPLSPTINTATTAISLFFSLHHHHLVPSPTIVSSPQPRIVYKQILPPFQTSYAKTWAASLSWIERRDGRPKRGGNVAAAGGTHRADCIAQNCREPESTGQRKRLSRLNASLRNCPNSSRPPHFRRLSMSNSIPFHSTLRTAPFLTSSPTVISLADTSLYRRLHPSSFLRVSLSLPPHST